MLPCGIKEVSLAGKSLYVAIHDVYPGSFCQVVAIRRALEKVGVKRVTLLAVPWYHGRLKFSQEARLVKYVKERMAKGDEVAMHGILHRWDPYLTKDLKWAYRRVLQRVATNGEGECLGMAEPHLLERLQEGLGMLSQAGLSPGGFVAPAWMLSRKQWAAVQMAGFRSLATFGWLVDFRQRLGIRSKVISGSVRTPLRRMFALPYVRLGVRVQRSPILRVEFHPGDIECKGYFLGVLESIRSFAVLPQVTLGSLFVPSA